MKITRFIVGQIETNCYFATSKDELLIVDPGGFSEKMSDFRKNFTCKYIFLTHNHYDHTAGVLKLKSLFPEAEITIHENDVAGLNDPFYNGALLFGAHPEKIIPDFILKGNETLTLAGREISLLHTPGHTEGSVSLFTESVLFSGDTLFKNGVGRCDMPSGDCIKLVKSLKSYYGLKTNYRILPGHGEETDLESERDFVFSL